MRSPETKDCWPTSPSNDSSPPRGTRSPSRGPLPPKSTVGQTARRPSPPLGLSQSLRTPLFVHLFMHSPTHPACGALSPCPFASSTFPSQMCLAFAAEGALSPVRFSFFFFSLPCARARPNPRWLSHHLRPPRAPRTSLRRGEGGSTRGLVPSSEHSTQKAFARPLPPASPRFPLPPVVRSRCRNTARNKIVRRRPREETLPGQNGKNGGKKRGAREMVPGGVCRGARDTCASEGTRREERRREEGESEGRKAREAIGRSRGRKVKCTVYRSQRRAFASAAGLSLSGALGAFVVCRSQVRWVRWLSVARFRGAFLRALSRP